MEDLRSGRLVADTARTRAKTPARNPHRLSVVFPEMRILVADGLSDFGKALVKAFRSVGMKVAFCATDATEGRRFAQESGARSCNATRPDTVLADILKARGGLDLIVKEYDGTKRPVAQKPTTVFRRHSPSTRHSSPERHPSRLHASRSSSPIPTSVRSAEFRKECAPRVSARPPRGAA